MAGFSVVTSLKGVKKGYEARMLRNPQAGGLRYSSVRFQRAGEEASCFRIVGTGVVVEARCFVTRRPEAYAT